MMNKTLFRKKYLGEVTLKNGQHVKFLFPLTESDVRRAQIESENIWRRLHSVSADIREYAWAIADDLDMPQFRIVYAAIRIYGKNYWKLVWQQYLEKNQKKS